MPITQQLVSNLNAEGLSVNRLHMLHQKVLKWYSIHQRCLPWRATNHETPNPYHVLVSEIMLQQTTVVTVKPYFLKFINRWPTVKLLAAADEEDLLIMWQGLGYYRRAKLLLRCAQSLNQQGKWPTKSAQLIKLPGIGDYTANAIAAIGFGEDVVPLDGNIIRILARFAGLLTTKEHVKKIIQNSLLHFKGFSDPGSFCQALMDLGSMVCKPNQPDCINCPLNNLCIGFHNGFAKQIPIKVKKEKKELFTNAYCIIWDDKIFLQRNTSAELLKNMMLPPMDSWATSPQKADLLKLNWQSITNPLKHIFTHINLTVHVHTAKIETNEVSITGDFIEIKKLKDWPLAILTKKIIELALKEKGHYLIAPF
jgi:A/G-specific adenine glycosylase